MGKMNVKLCITLVGPLAGVLFCRAKGSGAKTEFIDATVSNGQDLSFTFEVAVKKVTSAEIPDFGGAFVQGKAGARFVYLNIGQYAGQTDSPWKRRAKVGLTGISHTMLLAAAAIDGSCIKSSYAATANDGGPACASVPLLDGVGRLDSEEAIG
ncbi:MAG: hypothetical protein HOH43_16165 [Candidatus Latescibacteria bacterium]|nr:hypothetical protein [Candidatus Latescibacterota bacterium]